MRLCVDVDVLVLFNRFGAATLQRAGLYLYKREGERKKRREIGLDVVDEANAEMSASSDDKISGHARGSIGFFSIYSFFI